MPWHPKEPELKLAPPELDLLELELELELE